MASFVIRGGKKLAGIVEISGHKNNILPIMAASLLTDETTTIRNAPIINDVAVMANILADLGVRVEGVGSHTLVINPRGIRGYTLKEDLTKKLRASVLLMGPLLSRFKKVVLKHPGGCVIGKRALDTHFVALEQLGAKISVRDEVYEATLSKARCCEIFLDEASVTATENIMMAACLASGLTTIEDAACEPSIIDLAQFLNAMGAHIVGAGTNRITIEGVDKLSGCDFSISPDYIDAATFAIAAAVTKSQIKILGVKPDHLKMILIYLERMGLKYSLNGDLWQISPSDLKAPRGKIQTRPWPGFPTDLMSPLIVLATQADGLTLCHDWMYETRMFFVDKLVGMGANITLCDPHRVMVSGPTRLKGKKLESPDIRAGMALLVAAICAQGVSEIANVEIIERGYEAIESRLKKLGADITRTNNTDNKC